jgi:hypothetical protein
MSEQYREGLRQQIRIKIKDLCALSNKELMSLDKYEELSEKVANLLIYLDDLVTEWKTEKEVSHGSHGI